MNKKMKFPPNAVFLIDEASKFVSGGVPEHRFSFLTEAMIDMYKQSPFRLDLSERQKFMEENKDEIQSRR